jgi:hypothetical protein
MTISELKQWEDKTVVLHFFDGEITTAKIDFIDAEHEDIIITVLQSNRRYENADRSAFAVLAAQIQRVDPA